MTLESRAAPKLARRRLLALAALCAVPVVQGCRTASPDGAGQATSDDAAPSPAGGTGRAGDTGGSIGTDPRASTTARAEVTSGGGPVPFTRGRVQLGAYLDLRGLSQQQSLRLRRRQLGRDQRILHEFYAWTDDLPQSAPALPPLGTLMVSWRGTAYEEINNGSADRWIASSAKRLVRYGKPVLLRWGWEMNGDWFRWSGAANGRDAEGYVAAWRRLHRIFGEQGADNVSWVWSPNWNSSPDQVWNRMADYYPGDRHVDWVGVSGYDMGGESPQALFGGIYAEFAARKPIIVAEVGAVDRGPGTKADWITRFAAWVKAHPAVGAVVWFDTDTHPQSPQRWRIDTDAEALAAFKAMAVEATFGG